MNTIRFGCKIISLLIILALVMEWQNIFLIFSQNSTGSSSLFLVAIGSLFFILNITAAVGMVLVKKWGFLFTYLAILFSTIFFSHCYIPFITTLFPLEMRYIPLIIINAMVLLYVVYLNIKFYRLGKNKN